LDAISSISSRISYIEGQIAALRAGGQPSGTATATATAPASGASFAQTLASLGATGATGATGTGVAGLGAAGPVGAGRAQLNAKGVPVDLAAFGNGRIPATALGQVGDTRHKLWTPAADSLTRLMADARRDGVTIGITDSYRPYAEQVDLAKRKGLYSQGGLAARPGTSDHGWGMAVDLDLNSQAQAWMRANGPKYGFVENTPREPWHWAYRPRA
jgi:zinc D-Ala-D-Ala carboxypeptidase